MNTNWQHNANRLEGEKPREAQLLHAALNFLSFLHRKGMLGMLQTIEVEIDHGGRIYPLEPLSFIPSGSAYLTLLPASDKLSSLFTVGSGSAVQALGLLASPRFAQRPAANPAEIQWRIVKLCNDWDNNR